MAKKNSRAMNAKYGLTHGEAMVANKRGHAEMMNSGYEATRRQVDRDTGMIHPDYSKPSNLPHEVMWKNYPEVTPFVFGHIDDTYEYYDSIEDRRAKLTNSQILGRKY